MTPPTTIVVAIDKPGFSEPGRAGSGSTPPDLDKMTQMVLNSLPSANSRRAYAKTLKDFVGWFASIPGRNFTRAEVLEYMQLLISRGLAPQTINQRMSAIRQLAKALMHAGVMDPMHAQGIIQAKGIRQHGTRSGNWLDDDNAGKLLDAPDEGTLTGLRDAAILACMLGCGLRREECAKLTEAHLRKENGQWVIADLVGKGGRVRNVVMPERAKAAIDKYLLALRTQYTFQAHSRSRPLWVGINKSDAVVRSSIGVQAIYNIVKKYARQCDIDKLAPHDIRRTYAKLSLKGGADTKDIQRSLGHSSPVTTQIYLGLEDNFSETAPGNMIGAMKAKKEKEKEGEQK